MKVLVDTSVWSLALRRHPPPPAPTVEILRTLIEEHRVVMIGPVRQELLSGIKHPDQFARLRERLSAFPDLALQTTDYEAAAALCNRCMARGVQATHTDFLIAATTLQRGYALLTTDSDFQNIAGITPLRLLPG